MNFEIVLGGIALLSIILFWKDKNWKQYFRNKSLAKYWIYVLLVFFAMTFISLLQHLPWGEASYRLIQIHMPIVLYIFLIYLLKKIGFNENFFWKFMIVAGLSIFLVIAYELFFLNYSITDRLGAIGAGNPIDFGVYCATVLVVLLNGGQWINKNRAFFLPFLLAVLSALSGLLLSGSRSAWLGLMVALLVFVLYYAFKALKQPSIFLKKRIVVRVAVIFFGIIAATIYIINVSNNQVIHRITKTFDAYDTYKKNEIKNSSLRERLLLFEAGIALWQKAPLIGVGDDNYRELIRKEMFLVHQQKYGKAIAYHRYTQVHNQFLMSAVTRGILGLLLSVSILGVLFIVFFRQLKFSAQRPLALSGILITSMSVIFYFFNSLFYWANELNFFFLIPTLLVVAIDEFNS
jgi:O-antigen ligase